MKDHRCTACGQRAAKSCYRGHWAYRQDHDLCAACWKAALDQLYSQIVPVREAPALEEP